MASENDHEDFQQILHQIGGKDNIHLVSPASEQDGSAGVLQDFVVDMFIDNMHEEITDCTGSSNGEIKIQTSLSREHTDPSPDESHSSASAGHCTDALKSKPVTTSRHVGGKQRSITCSMIVFIFRHDYVCNKKNNVCLREILKDVRARVKKNALCPAVLGLIHTDCSDLNIRESVNLLDQSLRSVFISHPRQAIWTGCYVTKAPDVMREIKRNVCMVVKSSVSAGVWFSVWDHKMRAVKYLDKMLDMIAAFANADTYRGL